jgi:putative transposase
MARKRHSAEDIVKLLRTIEIDLSKGLSVESCCRKLGISDVTYHRWKREYGGLRVDQAKRLKEIEQENARLKKLVADLSLDNSILKEVAKGNF